MAYHDRAALRLAEQIVELSHKHAVSGIERIVHRRAVHDYRLEYIRAHQEYRQQRTRNQYHPFAHFLAELLLSLDFALRFAVVLAQFQQLFALGILLLGLSRLIKFRLTVHSNNFLSQMKSVNF